MIALEPIAAQLESAGIRSVDGAIEFAALRNPPTRLPAYYVVPTRESASQNSRIGAVHQKVAVLFQVVIVLQAQARNQAGLRDDLKTRVDAVRDALIGWQHPEASDVCFYSGGQLLASDGHVIAWAVHFATTRIERKI